MASTIACAVSYFTDWTVVSDHRYRYDSLFSPTYFYVPLTVYLSVADAIFVFNAMPVFAILVSPLPRSPLTKKED